MGDELVRPMGETMKTKLIVIMGAVGLAAWMGGEFCCSCGSGPEAFDGGERGKFGFPSIGDNGAGGSGFAGNACGAGWSKLVLSFDERELSPGRLDIFSESRSVVGL